jgi:hypothetical protein
MIAMLGRTPAIVKAAPSKAYNRALVPPTATKIAISRTKGEPKSGKAKAVGRPIIS